MQKLKKDQLVYVRCKVSGGDLSKRPRVVPVDEQGVEHEEGSIAVRRNFIVEKKKLTDVRIMVSPVDPPLPQLPRARKCEVDGCKAKGFFLDYKTQGSWCLAHALAHITGLQAQATSMNQTALGWAYVCRGEANRLHVCYLIGLNLETSVFSYVAPNEWTHRTEPDDRAGWTKVERCARDMVADGIPNADEIKAIVDKIGLPPGYQEIAS